MNCTNARASLPLLMYGALRPQEEAELRDHLASCPDCRHEHEALCGVRGLLDTLPVPAVEVDVPRIYQTVAARQARRLRRWRRTAFAAGGIAALLLLVVGLRLHVRLEASQLVVRWGAPPVVAPPVAIAKPAPQPADMEDEVKVLRELIHALKQDADGRDRQFQERLDSLEGHVQAMRWQADRRWDTTEENVAALYLLTRKGENP